MMLSEEFSDLQLAVAKINWRSLLQSTPLEIPIPQVSLFNYEIPQGCQYLNELTWYSDTSLVLYNVLPNLFIFPGV